MTTIIDAKITQNQKPRLLKPRLLCLSGAGLDKGSLFTITYYISDAACTQSRMLRVLTHGWFVVPATLAFVISTWRNTNLNFIITALLDLCRRNNKSKT